ncbi:transglycosylase domain-containing protein [Massilia sp. S19_KUP03_FR1]|uniref:transglycosylase domain-containing protein n=1 Tax=Massilia sp. S19_KUP03_FR1 TaxID=3025503 RepID=UPI002FCD6C7F
MLPACLLLYLAIVGCWAWAAFDEAIETAPVAADAPLTARQVAILTRVEDPAFFDHAGVSLGKGQGFATISGAVARDLYLDGADFTGGKGSLQTLYRALFHCCKRIDLGRDVMAVVVNARLSKERQLALYAGRVYMGTWRTQQLRGLGQAALSYFNKPLAATTDDEFIGLAAMIKAPNQFNPVSHRDLYLARVARVRALVLGECRPAGWFDTALAQCSGKPPGDPG